MTRPDFAIRWLEHLAQADFGPEPAQKLLKYIEELEARQLKPGEGRLTIDPSAYSLFQMDDTAFRLWNESREEEQHAKTD